MGGLPFRVLNGSGLLVVAVLAGCGGRSSTLDADAVTVEANQPAGGSSGHSGANTGGTGANTSVGTPIPTAGKGGSAGVGGTAGVGAAGSSTGGKAGAATGGVAGIGTAGGAPAGAGGVAQGGSTGLPTSAYTSCANYCSSSSQGVCPNHISLDECVRSCVGELSGQGQICQNTAVNLLDCLTKVYQYSTNCSDVDQLSDAKCGGLASAYQNCIGGPTPPPLPNPQPTCSSSGNSNNGSCNLSVKCDTGAYYAVSCYQTTPGQSSCTCNSGSPNGPGTSAGFSLNETVTFACYDSLAVCGFPQIGP